MAITTPEDVSSLIGDIYDTTLDPALWPAVLERLCHFVGAKCANIFWQDAVDETAAVLHTYGEDPNYTRLYFETYIHLNPFYPALSFVEPGLVVSGGDLIPHEEFQQTRFFKEWVAPQGFVDVVGLNIQRYPTSSACLALRRGTEHGRVDDQARRRVGLIAPHIRRAVLIGRQMLKAEGRAQDFEAILDAYGAAVFLVGDDGRLIFVNAAGRAMLDEGVVVTERNGCLTSLNAQAARLLRAAASGQLPTSKDQKTVSIALTDAAPRWLADVLPLLSGSRLTLGREHGASAAIFVRRAEIPAASGIEIMAKLYGLRASEIRVLHAVTAGGGSVEEIAEGLGISGSTVKTHLNALFAKTGTNRRSDLLREVAAHGGALT